MTRPSPPRESLPGYEWTLFKDADWRVPSDYRLCRRRRCQEPPVADFYRSYGDSFRWWAYCELHMAEYGRWIENGHVLTWRQRRAADA